MNNSILSVFGITELSSNTKQEFVGNYPKIINGNINSNIYVNYVYNNVTNTYKCINFHTNTKIYFQWSNTKEKFFKGDFLFTFPFFDNQRLTVENNCSFRFNPTKILNISLPTYTEKQQISFDFDVFNEIVKRQIVRCIIGCSDYIYDLISSHIKLDIIDTHKLECTPTINREDIIQCAEKKLHDNKYDVYDNVKEMYDFSHIIINPYSLMEINDNISLNDCNNIADYLGKQIDDYFRVKHNLFASYGGSIINRYANTKKKDLFEYAIKLNILTQPKYLKNLGSLSGTDLYVIQHRIDKENKLSKKLMEIYKKTQDNRYSDIQHKILQGDKSSYEKMFKRSTLNNEKQNKKTSENNQLSAFNTSLTEPLSIITGAGGTGKTFITRNILIYLLSLGLKVCLTTLAHKALNLYRDLKDPNFECHVVAMLLKNDILSDILIFDETSMISIEDCLNVIKKVKPVKIIFLGDSNQLPSIKFGSLMEDLCHVLPSKVVTRLTKQMRTNNICDSIITSTIQTKNHNKIPIYPGNPIDGVFKYKINGNNTFEYKENIRELLNDIILPIYEKYNNDVINISYTNEISRFVNKLVQKQIVDDNIISLTKQKMQHTNKNDNYRTKLESDEIIYLGDKIRFIENRENLYYNNEYGMVLDMFYDDKNNFKFKIKIDNFNQKTVDCSRSEFELGWCSTCHKFQGSEAQAAIIFMVDSYNSDINWIYTALSRAKKFVLVIYVQERFINSDTFTTSLTKKNDRPCLLWKYISEDLNKA